jgi:hypothetical protein
MNSDDLASLPAGRAATLIADGALSPVDLLESCLARIAARRGPSSATRSGSRWPRGTSAC